MSKKFFVISIEEGDAIKTTLKKWWRQNKGPTNKMSHLIYFSLLTDGWKSEVVGNEILLISPDAVNGAEEETDFPTLNNQNEEAQLKNENRINGNPDEMSELFISFIESYNALKEIGILRNQKDITGQLGEWVASVFFEANIATNGINQFWDLKDEHGIKYQVKSHAKALTTEANWTRIEYQTDAPINFIVIVVFDPSYKLRKIYKIPFQEALNRRTSGNVLNWSRVAQFRLENLKELKSQKGLEFL
jgi:hypothetical protein